MTNEIYPTPACECGAVLDDGQTHCLKCLARDRWARKQAGKRSRREQTHRPSRGPRKSSKTGVIWS